MKDKKIIIVSLCALVAIIAIGGVVGGIFLFKNKDKKGSSKPYFTETVDSVKFKEEYEFLNNTVRESDGANYNNVTISKNNPIKYIDSKDAVKILKNETAVIYVGAEWCPWCRNIVNVLFEAAADTNTKTIYYLNLDDEKSVYEVKDKKLVKTQDGTEGYYELLDTLKDHLYDYDLTSGGKTYKTGEKRIYFPTVIVCKDGEVVDTMTGSVTLNEGQTKYDKLTEEQSKEVYNKYVDLIKKIKDSDCNEDCN